MWMSQSCSAFPPPCPYIARTARSGLRAFTPLIVENILDVLESLALCCESLLVSPTVVAHHWLRRRARC